MKNTSNLDLLELEEWFESLDDIVKYHGNESAHHLVDKLNERLNKDTSLKEVDKKRIFLVNCCIFTVQLLVHCKAHSLSVCCDLMMY